MLHRLFSEVTAQAEDDAAICLFGTESVMLDDSTSGENETRIHD
jgi:hypothetical protein